MNTQWQTHLEQAGAKMNHSSVIHFTNSADELKHASNRHIIADLSHYGLIAARGEEASDFLQNQFSNDIRLIDIKQSQLSAYCNPKGRILASFRVFMQDDTYYLELPQEILEPTLKRLRMFVLRSKVILSEVSNDWVRFGLSGPNAEALLMSLIKEVPATINQVCHAAGITAIRTAGPHPRFELHGKAERLIPLWNSLSEQAQPVGQEAWSWLDTMAGIPTIVNSTVEAFVPQMINLHAIGGVSFKKGCYPGQEVVARMHYLGKLKRRMYRAHVDSQSSPAAGGNLYTSDGDEQSVGKVVQAQASPQGGYDLLAVVQIAAADKADLHLAKAKGPQLVLQDLPYDVTNEA